MSVLLTKRLVILKSLIIIEPLKLMFIDASDTRRKYLIKNIRQLEKSGLIEVVPQGINRGRWYQIIDGLDEDELLKMNIEFFKKIIYVRSKKG